MVRAADEPFGGTRCRQDGKGGWGGRVVDAVEIDVDGVRFRRLTHWRCLIRRFSARPFLPARLNHPAAAHAPRFTPRPAPQRPGQLHPARTRTAVSLTPRARSLRLSPASNGSVTLSQRWGARRQPTPARSSTDLPLTARRNMARRAIAPKRQGMAQCRTWHREMVASTGQGHARHGSARDSRCAAAG